LVAVPIRFCTSDAGIRQRCTLRPASSSALQSTVDRVEPRAERAPVTGARPPERGARCDGHIGAATAAAMALAPDASWIGRRDGPTSLLMIGPMFPGCPAPRRQVRNAMEDSFPVRSEDIGVRRQRIPSAVIVPG
jgi:hypothetical protein